MPKLNFNSVVALVFIVLALVLLLSVPDQIAKPKLFMGRALTALDPKLFPYLAISAMLLISIGYLLRSFRLDEAQRFKELRVIDGLRTLISLAAFLAYALALEPLGFIPASVLLLLFLTTFYGNRNWLLGGAVSFVFPVAIYWLFSRAFQVYLPESALW